MVKTNYSKVEEILNKALKEEYKKELLDQAQIENDKKKQSEIEKSLPPKDRYKSRALNLIKKDISSLSRKAKHKMFEKLGIDKELIRKYIENPSDLSPQDWQEIKNIQKQIAAYKEEIGDSDDEFNQELIGDGRKKNINKRHNIRDGWLPLDVPAK